MSGLNLIEKLAASGIRLWAEGDRLKVDAPCGLLTPKLKDELSARKNELIVLLTSKTAAVIPEPDPIIRGLLRGLLCLGCGERAILQDRKRGTFWCPGCRIFSYAQVI